MPIAPLSFLGYNNGVAVLTLSATLIGSFTAGAPADGPPCVFGDVVYDAAADK